MEKCSGSNAFGKVSALRGVAGEAGGITFLKELSFIAPFKVMSPFQLPCDGVRVMPLMATAGLLEEDRQKIHLETEPYTRMDYVSQAYEKLHKMKKGNARRDTKLKVGKGGRSAVPPLPVIPFAQSAFEGYTSICLENNRFCPAKNDMAGTGMFEGYSCLANVLFFHVNASDYTEDIRSLIDGQKEVQQRSGI